MVTSRKLRILLSSPSMALDKHRDRAIDVLRRMGYDVEAMEEWTADGRTATGVSLDHLRNCDLIVLLIARHLGHHPNGGERSITQLEFDYAAEQLIDQLAFFLDDLVTDWPESDRTEATRVAQWKGEIRDRCVWGTFGSDPESLVQPLCAAVSRWQQERAEREHLNTYFENVVRSHQLLNILDVPDYLDEANVPLERLYVEQAVSETELSPDIPSAPLPSALDAFLTHPRLVLLGDPGGGKTSLIQWIAWQFAADALNPPRRLWPQALGNDPRRPHLPIPMILREFKVSADLTWDRLWQTFLDSKDATPLRKVNWSSYLHDGRAVFLADGLDEVGDLAARHALRRAVHDGIARYPRCRWLLTSRVIGYGDVAFQEGIEEPIWNVHGMIDGVLRTNPGVRVYYLAPFDSQRIDSYASKWYAARPGHEQDPERQAQHLVAAVHRNPGTLRLARVPFLLSLMAVVHRRTIELPDGRALLYEAITDAYLARREKRKRLTSETCPAEEQALCLARIGIEMQRRLVTQENNDDGTALIVEEADVRPWLQAALSGNEDKTNDFLTRLRNRSGLLLPRGVGRYAFIHRSFQEFFAARFLYDQITSTAWIRGKYNSLSAEVHPDRLMELAGNTGWHDILIYLCELFAKQPNDRKLLQEDLFPALFGEEFVGVSPNAKLMEERGLLLARLVTNRHAGWHKERGFDDPLLQQVLVVCCRAAVAAQKRSDDVNCVRQPQILVELFKVEQTSHSAIFTPLVDAIQTEELRALSLAGVSVRDLNPIARLASLHILDLSGTGVTDLVPLRGLGSLQQLDLSRTKVTNLRPLAALLALQQLDLSDTPLTDLRPLAALVSLRMLHLKNTGVTDLGPLGGLVSLQRLDLKNTGVTDLRPLAALASLQQLDVSNTGVRNVGALAEILSLEHLDLSDTEVTDLSPLLSQRPFHWQPGLVRLTYVGLCNTKVSPNTIAALREARPACNIRTA